jgi:hypothetical protein
MTQLEIFKLRSLLNLLKSEFVLETEDISLLVEISEKLIKDWERLSFEEVVGMSINGFNTLLEESSLDENEYSVDGK